MDISPHSFVSANEILADVLKTVDDASYKVSTPGWYKSQIQQALEELSFDTFLDERNESFNVPKNLRLDMPKGAFNLRAIYLFRGDNCDISKSVNVYYKKNFINSASGNGYVASNKGDNGNDPFYKNNGSGEPSNLFYYSIQNGTIMMSESCRSFSKVMLVFNGIATDIGDAPIVPQLYRQAVKDYVAVPALEAKMLDEIGTNQYNHWSRMHAKYQNSLEKPYDGSWAKAEHRSKQLNNSVRRNIKEYQTRLNY